MYESVNRESLKKSKPEQQEYLEQLFRDDDRMEVDDEEEEEAEEEEDGQAPTSIQQENDGEQNSLLAVGYKNDRSFVVRGNKIGVFKHGNDELEFATSISKIADMDGNMFSPRKVMLHQQDSKLILLHPDNKKKLHMMDLEYGKVVDEWTVDGNTHVNDIVPDSKYAQLTHSQTMIGINDKAMFQLDGRLAGNKMASGTLSQYKTKVGLSAATTTGKGVNILI